MSECVVRLEGVSTQIGDHVIHEGLDLCVERGEILGLVGGSGSGKTTLLRVIMGLEQTVAGEVEILGQALDDDIEEHAWRELRARWGVLFQGGALFTELTVLENIALPLNELRLLDPSLIERLALRKLLEVGLETRDAPRMPSELSGGMVKRAGLARALALEPELLLLDEPTSGLDPASSEDFVELISSLRGRLGLTALVVTHDLDTLIDLCDRVAVLADRKLVAIGPVAEVATVDHPFIRMYFGGQRGQRALNDSR